MTVINQQYINAHQGIVLTKNNYQKMNKKSFAFVTAIVGGLQTIAIGVVTYYSPENATAINSAIVIASTAIIEICNLFTPSDKQK